MDEILAWFKSQMIVILLIVIGVLILGVVGFYAYTVHLSGELDRADQYAQQLKIANTSLDAAVLQQNAAIGALKADADKKAAEAQAAIAAAVKAAQPHLARAKAIKGYVGGKDDCKAADTLISGYLQRSI